MANEKVARLSAATIKFVTEDKNKEYILGYTQKVDFNRSSQVKELKSNDNNIGESVAEIETQVEYTLDVEVADLNLDILSLCFKGLVEEKTYKVGDEFFTGKEIKDSTKTLSVGDVTIKDNLIYTVTEAIAAGSFDASKCAPKTYPATIKKLIPEQRSNNFGKIICDGKNFATGKGQILIVPRINLNFSGNFAISGTDFTKVGLKGKALKKEDESIFTLIDA